MNTVAESKTSTLRAAWDELKKTKPTLRIRDCATELQVSEAELLATTVGDYTTRLEGDWTKLVERLPELGRVMSLTRNEGCVLEHKGPFQKIEIVGPPAHRVGTIIGPIEARVFFAAWKFGFAVRLQTPHGLQQSIQIFDEAGNAVVKVFLVAAGPGNKAGSNLEAFNKLVDDFTAADQATEIAVTPVREMPTKAIADVDRAGLLNDWENMKDTHDYFGMLRKYQVNRLDAVVLTEGKFSERIQKTSIKDMLDRAAQNHLPIMVFAGSRGNIQIHQGKIQTVKVMDTWLNILDPDFNMHLREDLIESVWIVKKPTVDGVVTAIEAFDKNKEMIVQFFGLRKPGLHELEKWRELVDSLPRA